MGDLSPLPVTNTDPNFVSLAMATTAASQVNNSRMVKGIMAKQANTSRSLNASGSMRTLVHIPAIPAVTTRQIADVLAFPDNTNPSFYIFNYVGGGYAIISADKRVQPILAFSNTQNFKYSNTISWGLSNWLTVNDKNMKLLKNSPALKAPKSVTALWAEVASQAAPGTVFREMPPPPCVSYDSTIAMVGPLLQTHWGQGYPYNGVTGYLTGCEATAMAQVMYYWQTPTSGYDWADMPLINTNAPSAAGNASVSQLMSDIGHSVSMIYGFSESTAATSAMPGGFSGFGYGSVANDYLPNNNNVISDYSTYSFIFSNLDLGWPVILSGETDSGGDNGHAWVCDGYSESESYDCDTQTGEVYLFYDMNWGEDGVSDGWYGYNYWYVFIGVTPYNFWYNLVITNGIYPSS